MTVVHEVINEMRLPPGVGIRVKSWDIDTGHYEIVQWLRTEDSNGIIDDPDFNVLSTTNFNLTSGMVTDRTKHCIAKMIFDGTMSMFTHEVKEWVTFRGEHIMEPHPELQPAPVPIKKKWYHLLIGHL